MLENTQEKADQKTLNAKDKSETLSFSSFSFFPYSRGVIWYSTYLILLFATIYFSLRYSAPMFSAILVFVSGFYLASTLSKPKQNQVTITQYNLKIDQKVFSLKDFESFWIEQHGTDFGFLHLYRPKQIIANKEIPYLNIQSETLKQFMSDKLVDNNSHWSHNLARISHLLKI